MKDRNKIIKQKLLGRFRFYSNNNKKLENKLSQVRDYIGSTKTGSYKKKKKKKTIKTKEFLEIKNMRAL